MWWMWIVGPVAVVIIYALTAMTDKRRAAEAEKWRVAAHAKRVRVVPGELGAALVEAGAGSPVGLYEIIPKLAYLGVFAADITAGSDHQTVVCRLEVPAPAMTVRPLPIVDGARVANTGVDFPKDPELVENYLVEGDPAPAVRKWLKRSIREALLARPDVWLRVSGKTMAVTFYGPADADGLDELLATADAIFAEHGADGAPALLYDADDRDATSDTDEDEEDVPVPPLPPKVASSKQPAGKPAASSSKAPAKQPASKRS